jgi:uncharacterized protein (DUF302 family)
VGYSIDRVPEQKDFDRVVARTREELQKEGFGVLTGIDVRATLKAKLGAEMPPCLILGACNPPLAHRVLELEPRIGVLLPCNVVVRQLDDGRIEVSAMDPEAAMQMVGSPGVREVAREVRERLARVVAAV